MKHGQFRFTIEDVSRLVDKAAVTLRGWERQGLVSYPRNSKGDRSLTVDDIRALLASQAGIRIDRDRKKLVEATLTILEILES